ncbi:hypothetical protein [Pseudomonas sp. LS-2]|uniref:hypothetical protein n=1 Tax=Pseudomonas sp. LS-2 TaxID=2315859 RepID=UPI000E762DAA|nr:hypothetical protein [Pseudomonas sp. LS-2]RJX79980.1 hypothetical protein D3M70_13305 [Pseudomonas sp. LS-2]
MNRYYLAPVTVTIAIMLAMVLSIAVNEKPKQVAGQAKFKDGTVISNLRFETSDSEDGHKIAVFSLHTGTTGNLKFAVHLNDSSHNIQAKAGDFTVASFCKGEGILTCSIPIEHVPFDEAATVGIAAYATPNELIPVIEGLSDWDEHRALFPKTTPPDIL